MHKIFQTLPFIDSHEKEEIINSLNLKWLTEGPQTDKFLDRLKDFTKSKYIVLAPNGTLGLYLSMLALNLPKNSEVIIPSFTFYGSATAVIFAGLKPVFADVKIDSYDLDYDNLEKLITKKTKAIMPVHIYGQSCNMDKIINFANKYQLKIIEDAAQGIGVKWNQKHVGTLSDISVISFFADKTITTGEGAAVLTQNEEIYRKLRLLRNQGRPNSGTFIHPELGMNFRITDIQAAIGLVQLEKFEEIKKRKLLNYQIYNENLKDLKEIKLMRINSKSNFVPFRFAFTSNFKNELIATMESCGIQTRSFFYPMHLQPKLKKYAKNFPSPTNSERLYNTGLCLPIHPSLEEKEVLYVAQTIKNFFK